MSQTGILPIEDEGAKKGKPQISKGGIIATGYLAAKLVRKAMGRLIRALVWIREERMQTQRLAAPTPPLGEKGPLRGRGRFVGGKTS